MAGFMERGLSDRKQLNVKNAVTHRQPAQLAESGSVVSTLSNASLGLASVWTSCISLIDVCVGPAVQL